MNVATFTELALRSVAHDLRESLLAQLPEQLRARIERALKFVQLERLLLNADEAVEYLLTVVKSGGTPEAAGGALYCFELVPDLSAFHEAEIEKRLSRNSNAVKTLDATSARRFSRGSTNCGWSRTRSNSVFFTSCVDVSRAPVCGRAI